MVGDHMGILCAVIFSFLFFIFLPPIYKSLGPHVCTNYKDDLWSVLVHVLLPFYIWYIWDAGGCRQKILRGHMELHFSLSHQEARFAHYKNPE
jgi:hypothetical protein